MFFIFILFQTDVTLINPFIALLEQREAAILG